MTTDVGLASKFLRHLGLRRTTERLAAVALLLDRPGLSASSATRELSRLEQPVDRRTVQRLMRTFWSAKGCIARLETSGPQWVCWGCGRAVGDAPELETSLSTTARDFTAIDFGGYCAGCGDSQARSTVEGGRERPLASASVGAARRAPQIPLGALYENPNLMRELVGSERRVTGRDFAIAVLAENPTTGPTAVRRLLEIELAAPPSLRSVKRYSASLRGPKAQMLFASTGLMGWTCIACGTWGRVGNVNGVRHSAPDRFTPTDVRGLCAGCHASAHPTCPTSDK